MVKVEFLGPINKDTLEVDVSTLEELSLLLKQDGELNDWLDNCAVAVNDMIVQDKTITLNDGDRVSLLPPVCGG